MMSDDVYILISSQKFKIDGGVIRAVEESGFQGEVFRRLDGIETEQVPRREELSSMREELKAIRTEILNQNHREC